MSSPTVCLFDIDGTLVSTGGAGRRAMERGFAQITGSSTACAGFSMAGMTDRRIVRTGLAALGLRTSERAIDRVLAAYLLALAEELETANNFKVLPGACDLLRSLARHPATAIGLGTGNVKRGARLKLRRGGVWNRFRFGGFGCDAEERAAVIAAGAARGAHRLQVPLDHCKVWVIGDTQLDVKAARDNGYCSVAVATGGISLAQLAQCEPTVLTASLQDPVVLKTLIGAT